jgi:hypothetical protein
VKSFLQQNGVDKIANGGGWLDLNHILADLT